MLARKRVNDYVQRQTRGYAFGNPEHASVHFTLSRPLMRHRFALDNRQKSASGLLPAVRSDREQSVFGLADVAWAKRGIDNCIG